MLDVLNHERELLRAWVYLFLNQFVLTIAGPDLGLLSLALLNKLLVSLLKIIALVPKLNQLPLGTLFRLG